MSQLRVSKTRLVSNSALNRALNAMGDRASLMVVQEAFLGASRFEEFLARTDCARSTLSTRLSRLIEAEILEKRPLRPGGAPTAYHLTRQGLALFNSMMLMWSWGVRWGVSSDHSPNGFVHQTCGQPMLAELRCGQCNAPLSLRSCSYISGDACHERVPAHRLHRKRMTPETAASMELIDLLGDRWTGLTVSALYFGVRRFDAIQNFLGIASNILADRLRTLEQAGLFKRTLYASAPARYEYRLTDKGKDLYPHALVMMTWADTWFPGPTGPPVLIKHECGAALDARTVCTACHGELGMSEVTIIRRPPP